MSLEPLPDHRETVIVVGTTVRKSLPVLQAYLTSLDWQTLPNRHRLVFAFVPDFTPEQSDAAEYLFRWVNERNGTLIQGIPANGIDFTDQHPDSHQWSQTAMERVGQNKDRIIEFAKASNADYLFLCDADLILDRTTLSSLIAAEKPIATAVYWTKWAKGTETSPSPAGPQVWLRHPYHLSGRGLDESEFRQKLVDRELFRVWGFGACTLLDKRVLDAGASFRYLDDVPHGPNDGLMAGEDRHFCIRTERQHIDAYADAWPDIAHLYRPEDVATIPALLARLGAEHPTTATLGDLVSLRLRPLEPLAVGPGRYQQFPPVCVRGRLGAIPMLPDLERAISSMTRGQVKIVKVRCPIHHPCAPLRGRTRLIEVTLVDVKLCGFAPVIEEEMTHA